MCVKFSVITPVASLGLHLERRELRLGKGKGLASHTPSRRKDWVRCWSLCLCLVVVLFAQLCTEALLINSRSGDVRRTLLLPALIARLVMRWTGHSPMGCAECL